MKLRYCTSIETSTNQRKVYNEKPLNFLFCFRVLLLFLFFRLGTHVGQIGPIEIVCYLLLTRKVTGRKKQKHFNFYFTLQIMTF